MKKSIFIIAILILLSVVESFATDVVITRTRINGDGTGKYNSVSRLESSFTNLAGDVTITIQIGCSDPGPSSCPSSIPASGGTGGGTYNMDLSLANYATMRMTQIDAEIDNGTTVANNTHVISLTLSTGAVKLYRVTENWNCDENGNGPILLKLDEISL